MTVDIARMPPGALAILDSTDDALARLGKWVEAASNAQRLVAPLVGTPFVPDAYRPRIEARDTDEQIAEKRGIAVANATAAVLYGLSLGIDPLMALQQIFVIHGRPGMYAKMMVALVQSRGHEVWTEDLTDTRAVVCGRRKGSQHTERITITMDMARKAKWTSNAKYSETPQDMLWARAAGRVCDRIASDVLKGIPTVEEVEDTVQATAEVGNGHRTVVAPRKRAAPVAIAATVADDEPPLDDETPAPAPLTSPSDPARHASERDQSAPPDSNVAAQGQAEPSITAAQQKKMHALLNETGRGDREIGLVYIAGIIGREVQTTKDLTKQEAGKVIDALDTPAEPTLDEQDWPEAATPPDAA